MLKREGISVLDIIHVPRVKALSASLVTVKHCVSLFIVHNKYSNYAGTNEEKIG